MGHSVPIECEERGSRESIVDGVAVDCKPREDVWDDEKVAGGVDCVGGMPAVVEVQVQVGTLQLFDGNKSGGEEGVWHGMSDEQSWEQDLHGNMPWLQRAREWRRRWRGRREGTG